MPETNTALNQLLLLVDSDPDDAFQIKELIPPLTAVLRMGDGSRWIVSAVEVSGDRGRAA